MPKSKPLPHVRALLRLTLALGIGAGTGCATKIYQGPTSGRAAEAQIATAASAEKAFESLDATPFAGKRVLLEVVGLTERMDGPSPEEAFVRALLVEKLLGAGAVLAAKAEDAEVLLAVALRSAGVDIIRRDVPLIYNHHTFRGLTSARVTAYLLSQKAAMKVLSAKTYEAESIFRETYIFYAIGPFQTRITEATSTAPDAK